MVIRNERKARIRRNADEIVMAISRAGRPLSDEELLRTVPYPELYEETLEWLAKKGLITGGERGGDAGGVRHPRSFTVLGDGPVEVLHDAVHLHGQLRDALAVRREVEAGGVPLGALGAGLDEPDLDEVVQALEARLLAEDPALGFRWDAHDLGLGHARPLVDEGQDLHRGFLLQRVAIPIHVMYELQSAINGLCCRTGIVRRGRSRLRGFNNSFQVG